MIEKKDKAVIILSGGLDSTTCMAIARRDGYDLYPITFDYGQKHAIELDSARRVTAHYGVHERHMLINLKGLFHGSSLTDANLSVPENRTEAEMGGDIPSTYVPARNIVFLSIALSYAESLGAGAMYIGVNALDYSGYPDCRPEFIAAFQHVITLGTAAGVQGNGIAIRTPLQQLTKAEISRLAVDIGAPIHLTHSCYVGQTPACGKCDACLLRIKGFIEAGLADSIPYAVPTPWAP